MRRWVGLTGTPSSNGLMDLWAEIGILYGGERLGKFIGRYREAYFKAGSMNPSTGVVFQYVPRPGAEEMIYRRISDITISMKALDYLNMPDCIPTRYEVEMNTAERELYDMLKQDLLIPLKDGDIDAANAASLTGKLLQMSNGAVYDENGRARGIHKHKLEALEDLIEAANGQSVLVAYPHMNPSMTIIVDGKERKAGELFASEARNSYIEKRYLAKLDEEMQKEKKQDTHTIYLASGALEIDNEAGTIRISAKILGVPDNYEYRWIYVQEEAIPIVFNTPSPEHGMPMRILGYDYATNSVNLYNTATFRELGTAGYYIASWYGGKLYNPHTGMMRCCLDYPCCSGMSSTGLPVLFSASNRARPLSSSSRYCACLPGFCSTRMAAICTFRSW